MKKLLIITIIFIIAVTGCKKEEQAEEIIRPVRYETIHIEGSERELTYSGISQAGSQAKLSFRISGTVTSVRVKVGDQVEKGDLIATLDNSDARLQKEQAEVALEKSRITRDTAESNLKRIRELYENNNVSLNDYENAKTNYAAAKAAYNADKRTLELQIRAIGYTRLVAPMKGIVTRVEVDANENVSAGQMIAELNAGDEIEVNVGIPEAYISKVQSGQNVKINFTSINQTAYSGIVTEVAFAANTETSTYPVIIKILQPDKNIRPGMPASVTFQFGSAAQILMAPTHAVSQDQNGHFVYIVKPESDGFAIVHRQDVQIGELTDNGFEILSGLNEGDTVVTAGIGKMREGLKVRML